MFRGVEQIRDAYRNDSVAGNYIAERFVEPLGALLHDRQVGAVKRVIATHHPESVLEIAPGPARLTAELTEAFSGVSAVLDASAQMLQEAKRRLGSQTRWRPVQGDAFSLPFASQFDLVYSFRLIRHFEEQDRAALYRQIARVLKPGGLFVFDAVNELVSRPIRQQSPGEYKHFDAMFLLDALKNELETHGFTPVSFEGVHHRLQLLHRIQTLVGPRSRRLARWLIEAGERWSAGEPLEWIVVCQRA